MNISQCSSENLAAFILGAAAAALSTLGRMQILRRKLRRASHAAIHDTLTGLANRTGFHQQATRLLTATDAWVAVVIIDLDDFKHINDRHGHAAGDEVLRTIASRLLACFTGHSVVARLGGDEFAAAFTIAPDAPPEQWTYQSLNNASQHLGQPIPIADQHVHVQASIGAAIREPGQDLTLSQLLHAADAAMYEAKNTTSQIAIANDTHTRTQQ